MERRQRQTVRNPVPENGEINRAELETLRIYNIPGHCTLPADGRCIHPGCNINYHSSVNHPSLAPYCRKHAPVYIKESTIPGGGMGLFAKHDLLRNSVIANYTVEAAAFKTKDMGRAEFTASYGFTIKLAEDCRADYGTDDLGQVAYDTAENKNAASYANQALRKRDNNVECRMGDDTDEGKTSIIASTGVRERQYILVKPGDFVTTKPIAKDQEIFLYYGDKYDWGPKTAHDPSAPGTSTAGASGSNGSGPSPALRDPPPHRRTFTPGPRGPPAPDVVTYMGVPIEIPRETPENIRETQEFFARHFATEQETPQNPHEDPYNIRPFKKRKK